MLKRRSCAHPSAKWRRQLLALPLLLALGSLSVSAQTGGISGVVIDQITGETLIGVNVSAMDAGTEAMVGGSATNLNGQYRIAGLPVGAYDLVFTYIGFSTQRVVNVEVTDGEFATIDVPMVEEAVDLGIELVVEARQLQDNGAALLRQRQRAAGVSDAIGADEISRSGSSTASDAMQKVTGASVVGGRYVVMRGLQGRYMNVQLNGATLPSADPDRNAVPLDLFPSDLLDNIVTTKTFTPDRPGDFTGGSVNLATRDFPDYLTGSVSLSSGFNTNVAPGSDILLFNGGRLGLIGSPAGEVALPSEAEGEIPDIAFARNDGQLASQLESISQAFSPVMTPTTESAPVNQGLSISIGNQVELLGRPLGFIAGFNWSRDYSGFSEGIVQEFTGDGSGGQVTQLGTDYSSSPEIDGIDGVTLGAEEVLIGGLANLSYQVADRHKIGLNLLLNKNTSTEALYRTGRFFDGNLNQNAVLESRSLLLVDRLLASAQLRGEHAFSNDGPLLEWNASVASTKQDEPDYRIFENDYIVNNGQPLYGISPSVYTSPTRYFRDLTENSYTANTDLGIPVDIASTEIRFKTGGSFALRDRAFRERSFQILSDDISYDGDPSSFFSPENVGIIGQTGNQYDFGNYIADATSPQADYDGTIMTGAGYLMADVSLTAQLRLIAGARVEANRTEVEPINLSNPEMQGSLQNVDVLPSANLVYAVTDNMNVRAAYGRTLARPSFRELAPYASFELRNNRTYVGNPDLMRTLVNNMDLRWEWFTRPGEILAVSGFYKQFANPIEITYNVNAVNPEVQPRNLNDANVFGVELEARRRLDMLPGELGNLSIGGNLTVISSEVAIRNEELPLRLDPTKTTRPLQGQSPYIANFDLGYSNLTSGTTMSLFYNLFGSRLDAVSISRTPDVYEASRGVLDFIASQTLGGRFTVKLSTKNLLNTPYRLIQTFDGQDYETERYELGRSFTLGLSFGF